MLYERVVEVDERVMADGTVLRTLDEAAARPLLQAAYDDGIRSVAIVFMHGYRFPGHEQAAADVAREIGFTQISTSYETSPLMKLVSRGDTTVVDAYLSPLLRRYVDQVAAELGGTRLMFMQSSGGLTDATLFQGKDAILSGPAGGIVGAVETAGQAGYGKIISFDMGGTSTDVAHYDGEYERAFETLVAGVRMRAPMMLIHTVAAGGGSICFFDGARYRVGPESAGADPGPASYRRGGPLCVTDCNVMLGTLQPEFFPHVFGPGQDEPLDADVVRDKFAALAGEIREATGDERTPTEVAAGFLKIAVENMANAIKKISVQRGYDVTGYTLNCFGGAGGQHACLVADALGMTTVLIHPFAGVLSAYGMGLADIRALRERAVEAPLDDALMPELAAVLDDLSAQAEGELREQDIPDARIEILRRAHIRYEGSDTPHAIEFGTPQEMQARFEDAHHRHYGFLMPQKRLIVEAAAVEGIGVMAETQEPDRADRAAADALPQLATVQAHLDGRAHDTPVFDRDAMLPGNRLTGPAIVREQAATTVVEPGWQAELTAKSHLVLTRVVPLERTFAVGTECDPVMLEVFNNLFMSIAEQMGVTLENTAYSVNIKERLDFSCALFDPDGNLVANAPHIPIHLGSMGQSVRTVLQENRGALKPGDVYVVNAPYNGGTHLPDVTVITPIFDEAGEEILFFVASRGHHADIGGRTPGSTPPDSRTVEEEGILFDNFKLVDAGEFLEDKLRAHLAAGRYPARQPDHNVADLKAQIAAGNRGVGEVHKMIDAVRPRRGPRLHAPRPGQCGGAGAPRHRRDGGRRIRLSAGRGRRDQGQDQLRQGEARGDGRLHRHQRAAADQLQRAFRRLPLGRALRLPHLGGRQHPAQRGLPEADQHRHPQGLHAGAGVPGRRRRRQHRDQPGGDRRALRCARRARGEPGDNEQRHLRQRHAPVLRDRVRGLRRRPGLRRHLGRAHAHDQHAAHRPGGAGVALPGDAGHLLGAARLRRRGRLRRRLGLRPAHPLPGGHGAGHRLQPPHRAALRHGRRRARPMRPQLGRAGGRHRDEAGGAGRHPRGAGRCLCVADSDGGRLRAGGGAGGAAAGSGRVTVN